MAAFERRLKVNKVDAFTVDVSSWLGDETITSLTVTDASGGMITIGASSIDGGNLTVLLTGELTGGAEIHYDYTTASRSDCYKAIVIVVDDC